MISFVFICGWIFMLNHKVASSEFDSLSNAIVENHHQQIETRPVHQTFDSIRSNIVKITESQYQNTFLRQNVPDYMDMMDARMDGMYSFRTKGDGVRVFVLGENEISMKTCLESFERACLTLLLLSTQE